MDNAKYYLRPNVQVEPLVDKWYAWSHLVPPATAARNITERHLKIMESYINAPQIHANAVKNVKLLGGPFIDYGGKRVDEIRALRDKTKADRKLQIQLSDSIGQLDALLRANAKGFSLQPMYERVPEPLRGYVELVYDLNNNPSFRLIESLLYRSKYYCREAQSIALSIVTSDDRPFVLSTPRLESANCIELSIPFDDNRIDWLFQLKTDAQPWDEIVSRFEVPVSKHEFFRSMFTEQREEQAERYNGTGVRWRYFGHACVLLETSQVSMLFDPVLSYTYESEVSRYTYADLPSRIDFAVITHGHQDHVLFETLIQIRHKVDTFIVPASGTGALQDPSLKLLLKQMGCRNVIEVSDFDTIDIPGGQVTVLPFLGEHSDLNIPSKQAYLIRVGPHALLFAADSCNIEPALYHHIHREIGDIDVLFLGMECDGAPLTWLYGPLLTSTIERGIDESRRLAGSNYQQAMDIVERFHCKEAYVYAMGQEPWLNYVMSIKYSAESRPITESNKVIQQCRALGMTAERLFGEKEILMGI